MNKNGIRERFIESGVAAVKRLRELQQDGNNPPVAVFVGGGLTLITDGTRLRFGSASSPNVAIVTQATVDRWNRENPQHEVRLTRLYDALTEDALQSLELINRLMDPVL